MKDEIIVSTKWQHEDGDERILALGVHPMTGKVQSIVFKGRAKDFQRRKDDANT